jgi:hypothetical protein
VGVIAPKAGKGGKKLAILQEIKERELGNKSKMRASSGTHFGHYKVDRECTLKGVTVFEDYSCHIQLDDISYNDNQ